MSREKGNKQTKLPSGKEYNNFVKQIEIEDIHVVFAQVNILDHFYFPSSAEVKWRTNASYEKLDEQFNIFHKYNVTIYDKETKEAKAKIGVTFLVTYSSEIPISDDLFAKFKLRNLPLNTWPYFREFVHNITMRMGWPPFIAPTYVA